MGKATLKHNLFLNLRQEDLPMESLASTLRDLYWKCKDYKAMDACSITDLEIVSQAENYAQGFDLTSEKSLTEMVRNYGGKVHIVSFDDFCILDDGGINILQNSIYVHDICGDLEKDNQFDIILSANCVSYERRFTLVHEFGHFVLHQGDGKCYANRHRLKDNSNKMLEDQADLFADALLLPEKAFKETFQRLDGNYGDLSLFFRVPWEVIVRRVKTLNIK